jgi:hypothetical protein
VHSLRDKAAIGIAYIPLVRLFKEFVRDEPGLADAIGSTIGYIAENENGEELIEMLRDKTTYGRSRIGLVDGLSRFRDRERLVEECRWMIHDPAILWTTLELIGRRKLTELIEEVREVTETGRDWEFRKLAKRRLTKLEKAVDKEGEQNRA